MEVQLNIFLPPNLPTGYTYFAIWINGGIDLVVVCHIDPLFALLSADCREDGHTGGR